MTGDNMQNAQGTQSSHSDKATEIPSGTQSAQQRSRARGYADRLIARARQLHDREAFEPAPGMLSNKISAASAKATTRVHAHSVRIITLVFALAIIGVAGFSLLLPYYGIDTVNFSGTIYSPSEVLDCYALWFQMNIAPLFDHTLENRTGLMMAEFIQIHGSQMYTLVMNRAMVTFIVILCGIMLALSGLLFQTSFRNPLATPSALGVSDGVTLGCIVFAMLGHSAISDDSLLYVLCVYGFGAVTVVLVLVGSRAISGGARYNVLDMLLLGTVAAQFVGGLGSFVQNFVMDYSTWEMFYNVQQAGNALQDSLIQIMVIVIFMVTLIPAFILRFRLNLVAFSNEEGHLMGVRTGALRIGALVLGSTMQLAAIASIGSVAMLSLAVPFLVRYMMPADFRSQFLGNCLVGVLVLLICVAIQAFAVVGTIVVPLGTIVSIFIVPFFVWMVAFGHGRWD